MIAEARTFSDILPTSVYHWKITLLYYNDWQTYNKTQGYLEAVIVSGASFSVHVWVSWLKSPAHRAIGRLPWRHTSSSGVSYRNSGPIGRRSADFPWCRSRQMKPNSRAGKGVPAAKSGSLSKSCPGKWVPIAGSLATHVKLISISGKKKLVIWIFCLCRRLVSRSVGIFLPALSNRETRTSTRVALHRCTGHRRATISKIRTLHGRTWIS